MKSSSKPMTEEQVTGCLIMVLIGLICLLMGMVCVGAIWMIGKMV